MIMSLISILIMGKI